MRYPVRAYHYLRFSSSKQRTGNSTERQLEWAKRWCEEKGINLDDTLSISDPAVSAFRGKHRTSGGLSVFLAACKQGRVKRGSYLLVESADRLSREHPLDGFGLVKELLSDYGVVIVTAFPAQEYSRANFDRTGWLLQAEFQRAYSESLAKSERSKFNWEKRRKNLGETPVTAKLPAWLKVVGGKICVVEEKAEVVRLIYQLSIRGFGQQVIARKLTERKIPPLNKASRWHESYVQRVLTTRIVLGEYQPHKLEEGVRVKAGELVKDYYPAVISEATWDANRQAMRSRRNDRGRISVRVSNLFTGIVFKDENPLHFTSKAGVGYLKDATFPGVRYDHFERAVLWLVGTIEINEERGSEYETLRRKADQLAAQINKAKAQIDADPDLVDMLPTLAKWKRDHRETIEKLETAAVPVHARHLHTQRLLAALATAEGEERETLRREVRAAIRQVVQRIDVSPLRGETQTVHEVLVNVELRSACWHQIWYRTVNGRVVDGHHKEWHPADGIVRVSIPDPAKARARGPVTSFPVDGPSEADAKREELRLVCRRMRDAGKSYKEIAAKTGLHRVTIYSYLTGRK